MTKEELLLDGRGTGRPDESREKLLLEEWKMASELHRHMDSMAMQGLNYFLAGNAALAAVLGIIASSGGFSGQDRVASLVAAAIAVVAAVVCVVWVHVQRRQQLYHHY